MKPDDAFLVHVSASESREIHAFLLDPRTGSLDLVEAIDVPGTGAPTRGNIPLAWSRDRRTLYAQVRVDPFPLSAFRLDPATHTLRLIDTCDLPAPMAYLAPTLDGRFLLGASYDGAMLTVNRIEADGRIALPCAQTIPTPPKAHCILEAPFGGVVYATSVDGNAILAYRLDEASGRLEAAEPAATAMRPGSGPRHLVFHRALDRLYCVNEHAGSLAAYRVDRASGALEELQWESLVPPDFSGNALGADIHVAPDGAFLYASVRKTHAIAAFRIDPATGLLSRAGVFEVEAYPRGFAIDPNGRFLLCAGVQSNHVGVYAIDPGTGGLTALGRYPAGKRPSWIEIVPVHA
ncbi:hypothetical protein CAL29_11790 [Bordetella genomosp. 10]|uniref:6-phosphogluconolactonase n=1 Tax=Bordetella genomosp. 10 TaxID=1416804 RepID=A0A261SBR7_9BORD|nr:lactonase family protein [Bordetella genomosp. 10]OZI34220.1 hypothetical protein CAL29_11790 [Bordetella genomosp. 10]